MKFNDKNFQDALRLAEEAKKDQIFDIRNKKFDVFLSPRIVMERMEITTKLSFLVSWFFYRKAVENGEISEAEAFEACPSLCESCTDKVCQNCHKNVNGVVKEEIKEKHQNFLKIKEECDTLYCRVARVDNMIRAKAVVSA